MDTHHLTGALVADLDPRARPVTTGYLRELAAALPGSRRARQAVLTEIADGLIEQIAHTPGPDPATAARTAISEFGDPHLMAARFAGEFTGKVAHRTGVALVGSGPVVGGLWILALTTGRPVGATLRQRITELFTALPVVPLPLLITVPMALIAIAGAGKAARILPVTNAAAGLTGVVAASGCAAVDAILIGHAVVLGSATFWTALLIVATAVSSARLILAAGAARRCAQLRSAG